MSIFEAIMLVCFGAAWPFAIRRTYTTKSVKGKSIFFLLILMLGYAAGITHKFVYNFDLVVILYIINLIMVGIDTILYVKYRDNEQSQ